MRIMLQWIYSKVKLLEDILLALRYQIHRDQQLKKKKEELLRDMTRPFGGFLRAAVAHNALDKNDAKLTDAFTKFGNVSEEEKKWSREVEKFISSKGFKQPSWAKATYIMTILFLIVTLLIHFYKADFVNLTVVTVAIYLLTNANDAQQKHFRYLVAGTILSFVYDVFWLILRSGELAGDDEEDGGMEASIRKFSLVMVIVGLVFKVIMTFVYWMASMRFEDIIDERSQLLSRLGASL